jgi:hypothetical protein
MATQCFKRDRLTRSSPICEGDMVTGKLDVKDIERVRMLAGAIGAWEEFEDELKNGNYAFEMEVGIEEEGEGFVQPKATVLVDIETGRMIAKAARTIIAAELLKLGVSV